MDAKMSDNVENILLEMLKGLRNDVKEFRTRYEEDMDDLKDRMSRLNESIMLVRPL